MIPDRKARAEKLLKDLRDRRASIEVGMVLDLLAIRLEEAKLMLIAVAAEDDFRRVQGEASAYDKLIKLLSRPSQDLPQSYDTFARS